MITYIKGRYIEKNPAYSIIETAGGVAYIIHISLTTFSAIKNLEEGRLLTHFVIKEDAHALYGFYEEEERSLFRYLIGVNGIGPNTALLFLSSLSIPEIINAIVTENVKILQSVKGVGGKTAQRVIIDLKDKVGKISPQNILDKKSNSYNNNKFEALSALSSLGFSKNSAEMVLDKIISTEGINLSVEELIKKALKML
jgi:Holliday junction DNA helicase RuvA